MSSICLSESRSLLADDPFTICELDESDDEFISFESRTITTFTTRSPRALHFSTRLPSFTTSISCDSESSDNNCLHIQLPSLTLKREQHATLPRYSQIKTPIPTSFDFSIITQFGPRPYNKYRPIITDGYCREHEKHVPVDICVMINKYTEYEANENTLMQFAYYLSCVQLKGYFSGKYLVSKLSSYFVYNSTEEVIALCTRLLIDDYIEPDIYGTGIVRNAFNKFHVSSRYKLDAFKLKELCDKYRLYFKNKTKDDSPISPWDIIEL